MRDVGIVLLILLLRSGISTQAQNAEPRPVIHGLGLTTAHWGQAQNAGTVFFLFRQLPDQQLALVGGQTYDRERGQNDFDIGLKYTRGNHLLRGTLYRSNLKGRQSGLSAGLDGDVVLRTFRWGRLSLLGDLSTVVALRRRLDFGVGAKFTLGNVHSIFFLYSRRPSMENKDLRLGYLFLDAKRLASIVVDRPWNSKSTIRGFWGGPSNRLQVYYDRNDDILFSAGVLAFGNEPLPSYAVRGFLASQLILTRRSVVDADYIKFLQSPFFLRPRGRLSDVLRVTLLYDLSTGRLKSGLVYNALLFAIRAKTGVVLVQTFERVRGHDLAGGGIGYRFEHFTPVLRYQYGSGKLVTIDFNFSY